MPKIKDFGRNENLEIIIITTSAVPKIKDFDRNENLEIIIITPSPVPKIKDFDRDENLEIYAGKFCSPAYIIKKSRPHKKSRFVMQLIPKGYNFLYFKRVLLCLQLSEIFLRFQMELENAANHRECYNPTPPEAPSKEDVHLPSRGSQAEHHLNFHIG